MAQNHVLPILQRGAVPHPQFGWVLPTAFVCSGLGISDRQLSTLKKQLTEGVQWLQARGADKLLRNFYTPAGLVHLSVLVETERSREFRVALATFSPSAIVPATPSSPVLSSEFGSLSSQPSQSGSELVPASWRELPQPQQGSDPTLEALIRLHQERNAIEFAKLELLKQQTIPASSEPVQPQPALQPSAPVTPTERSPSTRSSYPPSQRPSIYIENRIEASSGWGLGLVEAMVALCFLCLVLIGFWGMAVSVHRSYPQREVPSYDQ